IASRQVTGWPPLSWFCHCSVAYWTRSIAAAIRRVLCERANPTMSTALARHWPEYAMEAAELGLFMASAGFFGVLLYHPASATVPRAWGVGVGFAAEVLISFGLMAVVLTVSNTARLARFTGLCAGALVATWIILEAPLSGMSMNPARSFASALPANLWTAFWIYLAAPPLGMLLAAELHVRLGRLPVLCAKLDHEGGRRCIFRCGYAS